MKTRLLPCLLALFMVAPPMVSVTLAKKPYEESRKARGMLFIRPAESNAAAQLKHADSLRLQGKNRAARRQYKALYRYWPGTPEAIEGKLQETRLLAAAGKQLKAVEQYEELLEKYASQVPYDDILAELYDIGQQQLVRRKGRIFFGGFKAPEQAVPVFELIVKYGPRWERAREVMLTLGQTQQELLRLEAAIQTYGQIPFLYPDTAEAEAAAFGKAECLLKLSDESPNSEQAAERAWAAVSLFISDYPASTSLTEALAHRDKLLARRASMAFEQARFYDSVVRRPGAALRAYKRFIRMFPNSEWTSQAESRIEVLSQKVDAPETLKPNDQDKNEKTIRLRSEAVPR